MARSASPVEDLSPITAFDGLLVGYFFEQLWFAETSAYHTDPGDLDSEAATWLLANAEALMIVAQSQSQGFGGWMGFVLEHARQHAAALSNRSKH